MVANEQHIYTGPLRPCARLLGFVRRLAAEPKCDGFRFQIIKDGSQVRFHSRHGAEYGDRLPGMVEAFGKLPTESGSGSVWKM